MKTCPSCFGFKKVFDGEDYVDCQFCENTGKVPNQKAELYDPLKDLKNEFKNTE